MDGWILKRWSIKKGLCITNAVEMYWNDLAVVIVMSGADLYVGRRVMVKH